MRPRGARRSARRSWPGGAALLLQIDPTLNFQKANDQFAKAIAMTPGMGKGSAESLRGRADVARCDRAVGEHAHARRAAGFISGEVLVSASASDNVAVAGVKFLLDGSPLGVEDTTAPYELSWPTTAAANGAHVLTAIARDAAGNVASSTTSVMRVERLRAADGRAHEPGAWNLRQRDRDRDRHGIGRHRRGRRPVQAGWRAAGVEDVDPPYELSWNTEPVADGPHTWTAVARDASGKDASSSISVTVTHDVTAPTVAVIAPAAEATVSGDVTITTAAADDVGVDQRAVDPRRHAARRTGDIGAVRSDVVHAQRRERPHTLTAVARDAVGHVTTASAVSVTSSTTRVADRRPGRAGGRRHRGRHRDGDRDRGG